MDNSVLLIAAIFFILGSILGPGTNPIVVGLLSFAAKILAFYINIKNGNFGIKQGAKPIKVAYNTALGFIEDKEFSYIANGKVLVFKKYFFFKCIDRKDYLTYNERILMEQEDNET